MSKPFQSTRPVRGATGGVPAAAHLRPISIHAPRAGRDPPRSAPCRSRHDFNPRAPCGARRPRRNVSECGNKFQSTRPVRGATPSLTSAVGSRRYFNPRAPCGARLGRCRSFPNRFNFNPRAPCGARRPFSLISANRLSNFNPRAPCGARLPQLGIQQINI